MDRIAAGPQSRARLLSWILLLGAFIAAGVVALTASLLWSARTDARDAADRNAQNIVTTLEKDIVRNIQLFDLSLLGVTVNLREPAFAALTGRARQLALFDQSATAPFFNVITVLDENGRVTDRSGDLPEIGASFADRDYFTIQRDNANAGLYMTRPFQNPGGDWVFALSRRINNPDGSFGGAVVGAIRTAYFQSLLEGLSIGPAGTAAIARADGYLIARLPFPPSGLHTNFRRANLFKHFPIERSGQFEATATTDGVWRRFTFRALPDLPVVVVVGMAHADIYGAWQTKAVGLAGGTLFVLAAMIVLALLLRHEIRHRWRSEERLRESEMRYRLLADSSSDAIVLRDARGQRTFASPAYYTMVGRTAEELGSRSIIDFLGPEAREATKDTFRHLREGKQGVVTCFECPRPDGTTVWLESISNAIFDETGALGEVVTTIRDVTSRHKLEQELEKAAATDSLTGLMNRRSFDQIFLREWKRAARGGSHVAIIMIDIDHFKSLNDTVGHVEGDRTLKRLAAIIETNIRRPGDSAARYGGEEFVVVLPDTDATGAQVVAQDLWRAVRTAAIPNPGTKRGILTISLGVAAARPAGEADGGALVQAADTALYGAKIAGRDRWKNAEPRETGRVVHLNNRGVATR